MTCPSYSLYSRCYQIILKKFPFRLRFVQNQMHFIRLKSWTICGIYKLKKWCPWISFTFSYLYLSSICQFCYSFHSTKKKKTWCLVLFTPGGNGRGKNWNCSLLYKCKTKKQKLTWDHRLKAQLGAQLKKCAISEINTIWYAVRCYRFKHDSTIVLDFLFFYLLMSDSWPASISHWPR